MTRAKQDRNPPDHTSRDATRDAQIANRRRSRGTGSTADWGSADSDLIRDALQKVTAAGYALTLGYTRDAGAYYVRIVGLADAQAEYIRATEDIDLYLRGLVEDFT